MKKIKALPDERIIDKEGTNWEYSNSIYSSVGGCIYVTSQRLIFLPNLAEFVIGIIIRDKQRRPWWRYVNEIEHLSLETVTLRYSKILPQASIMPIMALAIVFSGINERSVTERFAVTFSPTKSDRIITSINSARSSTVGSIEPNTSIQHDASISQKRPMPWVAFIVDLIGITYFMYLGIAKDILVAWVIAASGIILLVPIVFRNHWTNQR